MFTSGIIRLVRPPAPIPSLRKEAMGVGQGERALLQPQKSINLGYSKRIKLIPLYPPTAFLRKQEVGGNRGICRHTYFFYHK